MAGPNTSGVTNFAMGRVDAGGFLFGLDSSDDGANSLLLGRNDEAGAFRYSSANPVGALWTNCASGNAISGRTLNTSGNPYEMAWGPKVGGVPTAAMVISPNVPSLGAGTQGNARQTLYYSSNAAVTFTPTNLTSISGTADSAYAGPHIAIDPNNSQIIYVIYINGCIKVTYNGGTTWHTVSALLGALFSGTATANTTSGGTVITMAGGNPINGISTSQFAAFDNNHELAVGSNGNFDWVSSGTSTTATIGRVQSASGGSGDGNAGVSNGDTIYFGLGLSVAIDGSSGTVTNPGIALGDSGASGVASKRVYFCFGHTQLLWWTTNGDPESATVMPSTGVPPDMRGSGVIPSVHRVGGGRIAVSFDGTLYVIDPNINPFSFTPSGASTGTWAALTNIVGGQTGVAPHPTTAGKVAFISVTGGIRISADYGATLFSQQTGQAFAAGNGGLDCPWCTSAGDFSGANGCWDKIAPNRVWICMGIGAFYLDVGTSGGTLSSTITSQCAGLESMIVGCIVKTPSQNGNILIACQDRPFMTMTGPTSPPPTYFPSPGIEPGGGYTVTYSDSDPTCCWASENGHVYRNTNSGIAANWTSVLNVGWCDIASTTSAKAVVNPTSGANVKYTTDSGGSFTDCLFDGVAVAGFGTGPFSPSYHTLNQDGAGNYWIYRPSNGKLYKSTDDGAHFITVSTPSFNIGGGGRLIPIKGTSPLNILWIPGTSGGGGFDQPWPLMRSTDVGATFNAVTTTYDVVAGDYGAPKPGNSFPAVYIVAQLSQFAAWAIYRCDDLTQVTPTWIELTDAKRVCCDVQAGGQLFADKDTYGSVYVALQGSGYMYGHL